MRESEMAKLLALAVAADALFDREVTAERVRAWMRSIGHLGYEACVDALWEHSRSSTESLKPAHIAALVRDAEWASRHLLPIESERAALADFCRFTGVGRDVAAARWNDGEWREARLAEARARHHRAAIESGAA